MYNDSHYGSVTIILAYGTTNRVQTKEDGDPSLNVPEGKTLIIQGTGSLNVYGLLESPFPLKRLPVAFR